MNNIFTYKLNNGTEAQSYKLEKDYELIGNVKFDI